MKIEKNKKISSTHRVWSARGYWPLQRESHCQPTSGAAILDASCNCCLAHWARSRVINYCRNLIKLMFRSEQKICRLRHGGNRAVLPPTWLPFMVPGKSCAREKVLGKVSREIAPTLGVLHSPKWDDKGLALKSLQQGKSKRCLVVLEQKLRIKKIWLQLVVRTGD